MFGISSVKLQRLMVTFSPVAAAGASVVVAAGAGVEFAPDELELEFEFPPHAVSADDITSNVETPTTRRFILFILCLPFIFIPRFYVTAFIIIGPMSSGHKEPLIGYNSTFIGFWPVQDIEQRDRTVELIYWAYQLNRPPVLPAALSLYFYFKFLSLIEMHRPYSYKSHINTLPPVTSRVFFNILYLN
jgi:hypothetical protein